MADERLVRDDQTAWRALPVPGASIKVLRDQRQTGESTTLIRFDPGVRFPAHDHPGGEQIFVLSGDLEVGGHRLQAGDYLYTPPNETHAASTEGGCVFLVMLPKPVVMLTE